MSAAGISRVLKAELGWPWPRRVQILQATDGFTTVFTTNGTRWQAASLSTARRTLIRRGYDVTTHRGSSGFLAPYVFYLVVRGNARRKSP